MAKRIDPALGRAALAAWLNGTTDRPTVAAAVRFTLAQLEASAPGGSVEVRVPPFGAVQVIEGTSHRRGTPPAVIEMDGPTWLSLAAGTLAWDQAVRDGHLNASGERADLSALLPLNAPDTEK